MNIVIREGASLDLHLSDIYHEKKPGHMKYTLCYCNQGFVLFRPFHSYILPILEYSSQKIKDINKNTEILNKLNISSVFINTSNDGIKWVIEYINTGEIWVFGINKPVAKVNISSVVYDE